MKKGRKKKPSLHTRDLAHITQNAVTFDWIELMNGPVQRKA